MGKHKCKRGLPHTPRINEKVLEYYRNFGQERDLEKFMRIHSPSASSQENSTTQTGECTCCACPRNPVAMSSTSSCDAANTACSQPLGGVCGSFSSKSMPNIEVDLSSTDMMEIHIQGLEENARTISISTECLQTPKRCQATHVQTPDSVAKSHRKLEWDSLGDIGYVKSMSTSNVSVLERSLLKEFFKEIGSTSETSLGTQIPVVDENGRRQKKMHSSQRRSSSEQATSQTSDTSLGKQIPIVEENIKQKTIHNSQERASMEQATPPLASSTFVEGTFSKGASKGAKPKMISQSTSSSSLLAKFEKYCQTSLLKQPSFQSQDVQVNMSKSNSITDGTATPSSFEYRSSRSSRSTNRTNSDTSNKIDSKGQHPFITSITELLRKRASSETRPLSQHHQENKENVVCSENTSSSRDTPSLSEKAPELDLGIQLICSLIDAKGLNDKQKHKLIRDIVKRILRHTDEESSTIMGESDCRTKGSTKGATHNDYDTIYTSKTTDNEKSRNKSSISNELGITPLDLNAKAQKTSRTSRSNASSDKSNELQKISQSNPHNAKNTLPIQKPLEDINMNLYMRNNAGKKETHCIRTSQVSVGSDKEKSSASTNNPSTGTSTCTSSSSQNLPTQKSLRKPSQTTYTEEDKITMREWLNPLTESEIEYEQRKRMEAAMKRENKKKQDDCGRNQQLNWIEKEIERLECLKNLLLKDNSRSSANSSSRVTTEKSERIEKVEPIYDNEQGEKSSVLSKSVERMVKEIEVILEESDESIYNLQEKTKTTKERKKTTKTLYDKPRKTSASSVQRPKFRTVRETITLNKEQLYPDTTSEQNASSRQRKKIDTPDSEDYRACNEKSLGQLVKEKKRDFMESYKSKKQINRQTLMQKERELGQLKFLSLDGHCETRKQKPNVCGHNRYYSVPHTVNRRFSPAEYAYPQSMLPPTPEESQTNASDIIYCTDINPAQANQNANRFDTVVTSTSTSTSVFCLSSEVSVPMGSQSTSTTTHQYDDVAAAVAGVAVQTSDSMLKSQPIFGPRLGKHIHTELLARPCVSSTAAIQVKPKGIAYVIEFDENSEKGAKSDVLSGEANIESRSKISSGRQLTLQDHLEKSRPEFVENYWQRREILAQLQEMRQARSLKLREIINNSSFNSLERRLRYLPPPPMQKVRILQTKDMKALTNKRLASLPEVVARRQRDQEEKNRRSNRLLRDVFNRRLQRHVRNGKLSLNLSIPVI